jgi:2',3'-cyclic-nucleotide 2'-phosphodiesterase/3'-nucleotidase
MPAAERVTITVLATTDMHGFVYPHDYFTGQAAPRGLAAAATLVAGVRRETPHVLLVDGGDTIQGSTLEGVHQAAVRDGRSAAPDPMMLAMNAAGYDAMVVGNHEFNYGLKNLQAARETARFPWLSANTAAGGVLPPFAPFVVKVVGGVKVAIVGVTTAAVPEWEKPEQIRGLSWALPEEGVARALEQLAAEKPDAVVVVSHGGLDRDPRTGTPQHGEVPGENAAWRIAERFPQLAAVIYGHTHQRQEGLRVGDVLLVQPRNWAQEVARIDLTFERESGAGRWALVDRASRLLPVTPETPGSAEILSLARPYHEAAERYLDQPVANSAVELSGERGRFEDNALLDAIHEVQMHYAAAPVSFAALFMPQVRVPKGPVTVRQLAALYLYDNELYAIETDGRTVRAALENAARYFRTCPEPTCATGPLVDPGIRGYNYDTVQGLEYEIDLNRPAGERVVNLRYRGQPLRDDEPLRVAVNNYRAAGSNGYDMFRGAKIVWRSGREIRDLMAEYFIERKRLPERPDGNWRLLPPRAVETLAAEATGSR